MSPDPPFTPGGATSAEQPAIPARRKRRLRTWHMLVPWAALMTPLCWWGLPSRAADALLFGGSPPWTADQLRHSRALSARNDRSGGADVDLDPLANREGPTDLTADPDARAAILLRYRLYSRQPDEMITFMALQRMRPRQFDFDPRLYQYGGGYIYLIGACIGTTSAAGLTRLTSDVGVYLEQPELFGRFYVVARLVSLAFGAATLVAVMRLARRAAGRTAGCFAFACVAMSPVFITGALEAKPHLPSLCMLLWAIDSAINFASRGRWADAARLGLQSGYAFGLVLTGVAGAAMLPLLCLLRRDRVAIIALAAALLVSAYVATNPYVFYNAIFNPAALTANLSNSTAMYSVDRFTAGALRVGELLVECCGWGLLLVGAVGAVVIVGRFPRAAALAGAPALAILFLSVAIGAGKPAEFARFLALPVALLGISAGIALGWLARESRVAACAMLLGALAVAPTAAYLHSFARDALGAGESRRQASALLASVAYPTDEIAVVQEPAPYATPPLDFAHRRIILLPRSEPRSPVGSSPVKTLPEWLVLTADDDRTFADAWWLRHYRQIARIPDAQIPPSPIAWANKPVFIFLRKPPE